MPFINWPQMVGLGHTRGEAVDALRQRLEDHKRRNGAAYGVDVADIRNGNLAQIFRRLHEAGHKEL